MLRSTKFGLMLGCLLTVSLLISVIGCGTTTSTSSTTPIEFYATATDTTPVFDPASTGSASIMSTWESGNAIYSVFYAMQEYVDSRDNGVIDRANIYRLLYDVDTLFNGLKDSAVALPAAKVITPPFNFGNGRTYESAYNNTSNNSSIALTETSAEARAIIGWVWTDSTPKKAESGVLEATYDKVTEDITVDFIFSVDYNTDDTITDYNNRTWLSGNASTHTFQFKQTIGGSDEVTSSLTQIIGQGISQGAGNYFLFKVKANDDSNFSTPKYLVVSAEATESTLMAIDPTTEAYTDTASLPATVDEYVTYVSTAEFFAYSDLLTDTLELNSGSVTHEGTIYLDY